MKKFAIIAIVAVVSSIGITYATNSLRNVEENSKCETGMRCMFCEGTGFRKGTNFQCFHCKGSGKNSSY